MSSVQGLREFVCERLTAAAVEIFTVFEQTIAQYETEISRHRKPLDISWTPHINLDGTVSPVATQQDICEDVEFLSKQHPCEHRSTSTDTDEPDLPPIKEEPDDVCTSEDGEHFLQKQESDVFMDTHTDEESDHIDPEPNNEHLIPLDASAVSVNRRSTRTVKPVASGSTTNAKLMPNKKFSKNKHTSNNVNIFPVSDWQCDIGTSGMSLNSDLNEEALKDDAKTNKSKIQTSEKPCCCEACGKGFRDNYTLSVHMRTHTGEKPYACTTCGKCYRNRHGLVNHTRNHTGEKPYVCKTCGKCYKQSSGLQYHMGSHSGEKLHTCKLCGKNFRESHYLVVHMRTHTGRKPYACKLCGKRFRLSRYLLLHMRTHTGEKPYSCEMCGKSFRLSHYLTAHMRTHTGEKPYFCTTCGKNFGQHGHLMNHQRTHK